ncbi:hypothetical protein HDU93_007906 [Gonapodya sp. JEL0774]|nr:hypothetical protein HDU93_007906 [Gonapodya sp. JEL0774]
MIDQPDVDYAGGGSSAEPAAMAPPEEILAPAVASAGDRVIYLNEPLRNEQSKFLHNRVSTTKYNVLTFLPKFFKEQFSKYANVFFLLTAIIQQIPDVSPLNKFTTIIPLSLVLLASAVKEVFEDWKRHASDDETNNRFGKALRGNSFEPVKWKDMKVGDILRIENSEFFPADLIILSSSEPDAICYIETSNLDGETNLKVKQGIPQTSEIMTPDQAAGLTGYIRSEPPNNSLYTYSGLLNLAGRDYPLDPTQLLLRGAQLRNTPWIYAIVVNTGHETKLMRNATATPIKRTAVERMTNRQILILFGLLMLMSLVCSVGTLVRTLNAPFEQNIINVNDIGVPVQDVSEALKRFGLNIMTFVILFNNLIPISLVMTMEVVKYFHAMLIGADLDMYYAEADSPAVARMSSLVEELGQIEYIFSDKTGTLTCNKMEFRMSSIAGKAYADVVPEDKRVRIDERGVESGYHTFQRLLESAKGADSTGSVIREFLTLLSVCHTVIPEVQDDGSLVYQASSPDEGALVKGAAELGYRFVVRRPRSVTVAVNGANLEFEVLSICEFNSTRKRMSAVVRGPDGKIKLFTKGADTVILERLRQNNPYVEPTLAHLEEYANEGLRTLCLAMREIPEEEYNRWSKIHEKASTLLVNRQEELDKVAEMIEKDLVLLGATAIEDKLQDDVPDTIHTLQQAGIKVWVLTGDRQETAINIGYSCKLLNEEMSLMVCNESNEEKTRSFLEKQLIAIKNRGGGGFGNTVNPPKPPFSTRVKDFLLNNQNLESNADLEPLALIIDGRTLDFALNKECELAFLELACLCKAVICCRVSPLQKALVVKLVKKHKEAILLAIGDGANDVSMIQAAHVGVGISGQEGLQAARAADFSLGQFRYLRKLLLVHGSWSYTRLSKLILYSFYKNITLYMMQFWFALDNGFSGQTLFESWILSAYNVIITVFAPIIIGVFDQYLNARMLDKYPQLYLTGQRGQFFNVRIFWGWTFNAIFHSLLLYYGTAAIWGESVISSTGRVGSIWLFGSGVAYVSEIFAVNLKAALVTDLWTQFAAMAYFGAMVFWLGAYPLYVVVVPPTGMSEELLGTAEPLYTSAVFWWTIILLPVVVLLRDFAWKFYKRTWHPESYHIIQEIQKYNIPDYRPRMEWFRKAVHKVRMIQRMKRNRGYAFSQNETGTANLVRKYDTTLRKPRG